MSSRGASDTDADGSKRQLSLRISACVLVYAERKVKRALIMQHHGCLLAVVIELEHCRKFYTHSCDPSFCFLAIFTGENPV